MPPPHQIATIVRTRIRGRSGFCHECVTGAPRFLRVKATVETIPVKLPEDLMKAGPASEAAVKKHG